MTNLDSSRSRTIMITLSVTALITMGAILLLSGCTADKIEPVDIKWTEISDIQENFPRGPQEMFLYISQNGCQYCQHMDSTVWNRPEIATYLNENYINVNINLDEDLPVTINNKAYNYQELFKLLHLKEIPAYFFFDTTGQVLGVLSQAMPPLTFKRFLVYIEKNHFYKTPWEEFLKLPEAQLDTVWGEF